MGIVITKDKTIKEIDRKLKQQKLAEAEEIRLLLLGSGESGKSTLIRQMKILRSSGYENHEKQYFKDHISLNLAEWAFRLAEQMKDDVDFKLIPRIDTLSEWCQKQSTNIKFPSGIRTTIQEILNIPLSPANLSGIHDLPDSAIYFFKQADRIMNDDYVPNEEDIVRCRVATNGAHVLKFSADNYSFSIIDVGGQRGQRKKWIQFFDNVNGMIYVTAISDYDRNLAEDGVTNRLADSLDLWHDVVSHPTFAKLPAILFFNKNDVFEGKLERVPLTVCFPEFKTVQESDVDSIQLVSGEVGELGHAKGFIAKKFVERASKHNRVFTHFTTATNRSNVEKVMQMAMDIVIDDNLKSSGIYANK